MYETNKAVIYLLSVNLQNQFIVFRSNWQFNLCTVVHVLKPMNLIQCNKENISDGIGRVSAEHNY